MPNDDGLRRIVDNDDTRRLAVLALQHDLEDAVLEILVVDRSVVDESDVGTVGLQVANKRKGEDAKRDAAETYRRRSGPQPASRSFNVERLCRGQRSPDDAEYAFGDADNRAFVRLGRKSFEHQMPVGVQMERAAVEEGDDGDAIVSGIENIAFTNGVAERGVCRRGARSADGDRAE